MGTRLYSKGIFINRCFEEANLSTPYLVSEIHREYIKAGADILETNTFGANRFKLKPYGLVDKLSDIVKAGVRLARNEAKSNCFIAGSIGPLGIPIKLDIVNKDEVHKAFAEVADILAKSGADLLLLETFHDIIELETALNAVRSVCDLPVIIQAAVPKEEKVKRDFLDRMAELATRANPDVIGLNCGSGPHGILEDIKYLSGKVSIPLSAQPNAGEPQTIDGRTLYLTTPEYMAEFTKRLVQYGVKIVGGCCGTGPEHIKAIREVVKSFQPVENKSLRPIVEVEASKKKNLISIPAKKKSAFGAKLGKQFVTCVELDPPHGLDPTKIIENAVNLAKAGVDAVNIADGPRATARMNPVTLATFIKRKTTIEPIVHVCCRDRNIIGLQSDLIGAHTLGINNILAITGDPPKLGNYDYATGVFDVDSIGLVQMIQMLNNGMDLTGNSLGAATRFLVGIGANPGAINLDKEIVRFKRKVDAGAEYALTQPVYTIQLLETFLNKVSSHKIPILVGILPLASARNADFLHNEVPGMSIPKEILSRIHSCTREDEAKKEGILIAQEALIEAENMVDGVYIMPPFGRVSAAIEVLSILRN